MATKKDAPTPERCTCGKIPVAARAKGSGWVIACPAGDDCNNRAAGRGQTLGQAVEAWNNAIRTLLYKEARK